MLFVLSSSITSVIEMFRDPMDCTNIAMSVDVRVRKIIILHSGLYVLADISCSHLISAHMNEAA